MPVLQRTTPVLLCTTKHYASTTCTTKYYSSTTLYYKVLRQYYSVQQSTTKYYSVLLSTTPVLLCTTKYYASTTTYYSSTTLNYKVLRQYYSVLQSTTPVISNARSKDRHPATSPNTVPATQNASHQWSVSHMKRHFQCAEQQEAASNFTNCCACHTKWMSPVICDTYQTSFPMRGASKGHPATSPNTAPCTQNECHQWSASHMKPHFQCVEQVKSPSNLTKYCACHEILKLKISAETPWMLPPIERRFDDNPRISDQIRR